MTQLKAYFIALGGDLESLLSRSKSVFDRMILQNFNTHLQLTLLSNPDLIRKHQTYLDFVKNFLSSSGLPSCFLYAPYLENHDDHDSLPAFHHEDHLDFGYHSLQ